jgi:hypothetical protein
MKNQVVFVTEIREVACTMLSLPNEMSFCCWTGSCKNATSMWHVILLLRMLAQFGPGGREFFVPAENARSGVDCVGYDDLLSRN